MGGLSKVYINTSLESTLRLIPTVLQLSTMQHDASGTSKLKSRVLWHRSLHPEVPMWWVDVERKRSGTGNTIRLYLSYNDRTSPFPQPHSSADGLYRVWCTNSNAVSKSRTVRHSTHQLRDETLTSFRSQVRAAWGTADWREILGGVGSPALIVPLTPDGITVQQALTVSSPFPNHQTIWLIIDFALFPTSLPEWHMRRVSIMISHYRRILENSNLHRLIATEDQVHLAGTTRTAIVSQKPSIIPEFL